MPWNWKLATDMVMMVAQKEQASHIQLWVFFFFCKERFQISSFFFFEVKNLCFFVAGTWVTASAHIITAVIGSGVLSLSWAIAQLGWIAGPMALVIFSIITWFTSTLLADSCRDPYSIWGVTVRCSVFFMYLEDF